MSAQQVAKVDWVNMTFPKPTMSAAGMVSLLGRMLGREVSAVEGGGMLGFESAVKLFAHHGATKSAIGSIAFGGESQNGRWLLQLTGVGCGFVSDWDEVREFGEGLDAKLTRVDLAADFIDGQYSIEEVVDWYGFGGFDFDGRIRPNSDCAGDWLGGRRGRTFYVGNIKNGKELCAYEKGKQLGDAESEWLRLEVRFGSRDRVIPWDILTNRDAFFAGAYPALAEVVDAAAETIRTSREKAQVPLAHLVHHMRRCYGKVVDVICRRAITPVESSDLVDAFRISGTPRRLDASSAEAGVIWADVLARSKRKQSPCHP